MKYPINLQSKSMERQLGLRCFSLQIWGCEWQTSELLTQGAATSHNLHHGIILYWHIHCHCTFQHILRVPCIFCIEWAFFEHYLQHNSPHALLALPLNCHIWFARFPLHWHIWFAFCCLHTVHPRFWFVLHSGSSSALILQYFCICFGMQSCKLAFFIYFA